ncbi:hypothetical protein ACUXZZ_45545 (plasmid) [Streptomyces graminifolii]|uniref:hypothetical protein n=1 Tax=Streptomyces graminifolii TaxID=1266771 RepID=UPI004058DCA3
MPTPPDDAFTELIDADIDRVDLVDKAANGLPILMAKAEEGAAPGGLVEPDVIRDLLGKTAGPAAPAQTADDPGWTVTLTGRPGYDALNSLLTNHGGRLVPDIITKDSDVAAEPDLDPTKILAEPEGSAPGSPDVPGSPAWEAVDAATARKWTAILSRAKTALGVMVERELLEPTDGDPDDFNSVMDLGDAACAIDYAISLLAPFAVGEQAEVDSVEALEAIGKAALDGLSGPLEVVESLGQVRKAGRSLSASNERAIREAVESLQKVLASLPAAPETTESGQPVAKKESNMPETGTPETTVDTTAVAPEAVAKADGEGKAPMVAVYDAKGKLVGIVDPTEITPISGADATDETEPEAPAAAADDLEPAPAAAVGVPAEDVAKGAPADDTTVAPGDDVTKTTPGTEPDVSKSSDLAELVKGMLDEHSATQTELITKQSAAIVELAGLVETLKGQVQTLEEQPATPSVFANGAQPMLRGQDRGAPPVDVAKARELRDTLHNGTAREQNAAAIEMQKGAIAELARIHNGG